LNPMGKWVHRMISVDPTTKSGVCAECGPVRVKKKQKSYVCGPSQQRFRGEKKKPSTEVVDRILGEQGGVCAVCGSIPKPPVLDHCHSTGFIRVFCVLAAIAASDS
jgi:hypothetical protein